MTAATITINAVPQRSFREVWVISVGHALTHWYPATFYILLPLIGNELGLDYAQIGSILTAQYAAGAIANIPGGIFVDTVGRKALLMAVSLCWIGIPYLIMGASHTYWMILVCAMLVGVGNNIWHPTAIPWLGDRFPDRKGLAMSFHGMGANVGDALAPLCIGWLLTFYSWRSVVVMNVIPGIVVAGVILIYVGRLQSADIRNGWTKAKPDKLPPGERLRLFGELLRNRALVMLSIGSAFRSITQGALLTFLPVYLARVMDYPTKWIGACMFALQACGFVAAPIAGHLSDKIGRRQIIMSSMSMTAVVILAMTFAGGTGWFVLLVAVLGFFLFAVRAVLQAWLLDATPPGTGGTAVGILFGAQAIGMAIGPVTAGIVADHYGIMAAFYFLAGTIIIANLMIFITPVGQLQPSKG